VSKVGAISGPAARPGPNHWPQAQVFTWGLRQKLVVLSLLILIVVSFGFLFLHRWLSNAWLEQDLRDRAVFFGREISATIDDREELESGPKLEEAIRRVLAARPDVLQIDVFSFYEGESVMIASNGANRMPFSRDDGKRVRAGEVVARLSQQNGVRVWDVLSPVVLNHHVIGAVGTRFSLDRADRLRNRVNLWALVLTGVSVLIMGSLMTAAVHYTVNRPIGGLLKAIRNVEPGDNLSRVEVSGSDEFHTLASHFNAMMERIQHFNEEMDSRINKATREINDRYKEVQRLNNRLYELQQQLLHAERLSIAGRMVAQVAHEIGTPLHAIAGHLELLRAELDKTGTTQPRKRLQIIEEQIQRMSGILRQLLSLVRSDAPAHETVDAAALIRECVDLVTPGIHTNGLSLALNVDRDVPPVFGNRAQLMQVILNLLSNAIDATPRGGTITINARKRRDGNRLQISVEDTGIGIPAHKHKEIFAAFVTTKPHGKGTGLGLYLASEIVRDHGGHIEVASKEGAGSTMTVVLPAARAA